MRGRLLKILVRKKKWELALAFFIGVASARAPLFFEISFVVFLVVDLEGGVEIEPFFEFER